MTGGASSDSRRLGRYYTPADIAEALAGWAVWDRSCRVLDPSFGGCAFLYAAIKALRHRGTRRPGRLLYGVDVDPEARRHLNPLFQEGAEGHRFITGDFLAQTPSSMKGTPFQVVVGNPPYIRHHFIQDKFGLHKRFLARNGTERLSARADYWGYFLLHALEFVAPRGRMAMVLPASFLHANYAQEIRRRVLESFARVTIVLVRQRLFAEAEEMSVLLLAEGRGEPNRGLRIGVARSAQSVSAICRNMEGRTKAVDLVKHASQWQLALLEDGSLELYRQLCNNSHVSSLHSIADIHIGTVTGSNETFVISDETRQRLKVARSLTRPIVSRAAYLRGLVFRDSDHKKLVQRRLRALLLIIPSEGAVSCQLGEYFKDAEEEGISGRFKCSVRDPWYCIGKPTNPDAFLHYMSSELPHIVLNYSSATCTNAIHQLFWKRKLSAVEREWIALSSLSTLFQLGAEINGRCYGGGVLKVEPGEAAEVPIVERPHNGSNPRRLFRRVHSLLRSEQTAEAILIVDDLVLRKALGLSEGEVVMLADACALLRRLRLPPATKPDDRG